MTVTIPTDKKAPIEVKEVDYILPEKLVVTNGGIKLEESEAFGAGDENYAFSCRVIDIYAPREFRCLRGVRNPTTGKVTCTESLVPGFDYIGNWRARPFSEEGSLTHKTYLDSFVFDGKKSHLSKEERFDILRTLAERDVWIKPTALKEFAGGKEALDEFLKETGVEVINPDLGCVILRRNKAALKPKVVAYGGESSGQGLKKESITSS